MRACGHGIAQDRAATGSRRVGRVMSQEVHTRLRVSAVLIGVFAVIGIVFAGAPVAG